MKNVYLFGECYFVGIELFLNKQDTCSEFNFQNLSISNGSMQSFATMLKSNKNIERGIFLVGGSMHDKWGWNNGKILSDVLKWFETYFFDSLLVFCLTGPLDQESIHNFYNEEKLKVINKINIFSIDLRFDTEESYDGIHIGYEKKCSMAKNIIDVLKTFEYNYDIVELNSILDNIELKSNYKNVLIFHGNNKSILEVKNNEKTIRKYAFYDHPLSKSNSYVPYLDREIVTEIKNAQVGTINFSEPIFVRKIIFERN